MIGIRVRMMGIGVEMREIRVRMGEIRVGMRGIGSENEENQGDNLRIGVKMMDKKCGER